MICDAQCTEKEKRGRERRGEERESGREFVTAQPRGCKLTGFTRATHPEDPSPRRGKPLRHDVQAHHLQALDAREREKEGGSEEGMGGGDGGGERGFCVALRLCIFGFALIFKKRFS